MRLSASAFPESEVVLIDPEIDSQFQAKGHAELPASSDTATNALGDAAVAPLLSIFGT